MLDCKVILTHTGTELSKAGQSGMLCEDSSHFAKYFGACLFAEQRYT